MYNGMEEYMVLITKENFGTKEKTFFLLCHQSNGYCHICWKGRHAKLTPVAMLIQKA